MADTFGNTIAAVVGYALMIGCTAAVLCPLALRWLIQAIEQSAILLIDLLERLAALWSVHKGHPGRSTDTKKPVFGMLQRDGEMRAAVPEPLRGRVRLPIQPAETKFEQYL